MEMYRADDVVVYDVYGLCRVKEIKKLTFVRSEPKEDYYVLVPLTGAASQYYVPVGNEKAVSKLRRPFSKEKLDEILSQVKDEDYQWIENRQLRNETFQTILGRGVTAELISLVKCIYCRKEALAQRKKRLSASDESVFTAAEKLLNEEFSYALGIEKEKVSEYIGRYFLSKE